MACNSCNGPDAKCLRGNCVACCLCERPLRDSADGSPALPSVAALTAPTAVENRETELRHATNIFWAVLASWDLSRQTGRPFDLQAKLSSAFSARREVALEAETMLKASRG